MSWVQCAVIEMDDPLYYLRFACTCVRASAPSVPRGRAVTLVVFGHRRARLAKAETMMKDLGRWMGKCGLMKLR